MKRRASSTTAHCRQRLARPRAIVALASFVLLLQTLIPSGYMPGTLQSGRIAVLCPHGLPAEFVAQLQQASPANATAAHHHHGHAEDSAGSAKTASSAILDTCDLGAGLDQPALLAVISPVTLAVAAVPQRSWIYSLTIRTDPLPKPQPRGPPLA